MPLQLLPVGFHFYLHSYTTATSGQEMFCHYRRSAPATKQRDKMCLWSTAGTPNPPGQALPDTRQGLRSLLVKSDLFDDIPAAPGGLANASRSHSKLRARSPLFARFSRAFEGSAGF